MLWYCEPGVRASRDQLVLSSLTRQTSGSIFSRDGLGGGAGPGLGGRGKVLPEGHQDGFLEEVTSGLVPAPFSSHVPTSLKGDPKS